MADHKKAKEELQAKITTHFSAFNDLQTSMKLLCEERSDQNLQLEQLTKIKEDLITEVNSLKIQVATYAKTKSQQLL